MLHLRGEGLGKTQAQQCSEYITTNSYILKDFSCRKSLVRTTGGGGGAGETWEELSSVLSRPQHRDSTNAW